MQIVSIGDSLHKMSNPVFWEKSENISKCCLLKILPRVLSVSSIIWAIAWENVQPGKTQISLRICAVWSGFSLST